VGGEWGVGRICRFPVLSGSVQTTLTIFVQVEEAEREGTDSCIFRCERIAIDTQAQLHKMNFVTEQGEKNLHQVILELRALVVVDR
jgi:hypothetical protein